ncbi:MAG: GspH/FimT family pseudopilin [Pseudomonadota bacterium]
MRQSQKKCLGPSSGFTLLELLVTITVASILLTLAVPSFNSLTQNNRRSSYVGDLLRTLAYARNQAVTSRSTITVCPSAAPYNAAPTCAANGWHTGWVVFREAGTPNGIFDAGELVLAVHEPLSNANTTICGDANLGDGITFTNAGVLRGGAGSLSYCDARGIGEGRSIIVATFGRVRSDVTTNCRRDTSSPPACS